MNGIREWVVQVRYPYTAAVIAVVWVGTALFAIIVPSAPVEILVSTVAAVTLLIASVGFSSKSR